MPEGREIRDDPHPASRHSLTALVAVRIILFAALAAALQALVIFADYYFDDTKLADLMVEREAGLLAQGIRHDTEVWHFELPAGLRRYGPADPSYVTRIRTPEGDVIYSNCDAACQQHLLPLQVNPPDTWSRIIDGRGAPRVAGGKTFTIDRHRIFIELAVLDDEQHALWGVFADEFKEHLAIPMSIMLAFLLGGTLGSIHIALAPVRRAARAAEKVDPLETARPIDIAGMPREIAEFGAAINRNLSRIRDLMTSQRLFTTAVAHEIRTPLAMMQLELGHVDHPRARKIEADIADLARLVGQITALGRLEDVDRAGWQSIDPAAIARQVVSDIAPYVYEHGHTIGCEEAGADLVRGHAPLIYDAVRNLVENAVKHTPAGTTIEVKAGPGPVISVSDSAGLYTPASARRPPASADRLGVGLEIVGRIMALHRGELRADVENGVRTTICLRFPAIPAVDGKA